MIRLLLWPGDLACDAAGLPAGSDHRQVLRMFVNMLVWSLVGVIVIAVVLV